MCIKLTKSCYFAFQFDMAGTVQEIPINTLSRPLANLGKIAELFAKDLVVT